MRMHAGRIVLGSIAMHLGLLVLVVHWLDQPVRIAAPQVPPREELIEISVVPRDVEPLEIAILKPLIEAPIGPPALQRSALVGSSSEAITTTASPNTASEQSPRGTEPSSPFMRMRRPDLRPDRAAMELIAARGVPAPQPMNPSGRLRDAPNGEAVIDDAAATVSVDKDGTAHIHDKQVEVQYPIAQLAHSLVAPKVLLHDIGEDIANWYADPDAGKRFGPTQDLPRALQAIPGQCDGWGKAMCDDANAPDSERNEREARTTDRGFSLVRDVLRGRYITGNMDITAYLMRKAGVGDAFASRKLALLDDTRDERAARGASYRAEQLVRSAETMRENLEHLWTSTMSAEARRMMLFELWDECAEGDGPVGEAGTRARSVVIGWIRARLTPPPYTAKELEALNARRASKQEFVP
ncbi:MAG: hypothetical protein JWO36_139 [Myxococcales bacterium]|nr:hypothetical protein [Myxococcales bacterium]